MIEYKDSSHHILALYPSIMLEKFRLNGKNPTRN
jgi:hypothetical protein